MVCWYADMPYGEVQWRPMDLRYDTKVVYGTFRVGTEVSSEFRVVPYLYCLEAFRFELHGGDLDAVSYDPGFQFYQDDGRNKILQQYKLLREKEPWLNA